MGAREDREEELVREIGRSIGYGRTMQLCEKLWREDLVSLHGLPPGGEHSVGPCVAMLVPCPCPDKNAGRTRHCDWCCGSGRITKRVLMAIEDAESIRLRGVPRLTDDQLGTPAEVERLEAALRFIGSNCDDPEMVRDYVSRALRGKSIP